MDMRNLIISFLIFCLTIGFNLSCEKNPTAISSKTSYQWPVSTPAEQGLNESILSNAFLQAEQSGFVNSLLIIRNGFLVSEQYFRGYDANSFQDVMSVSKSFISALVGLALREGYLDSLDQKMLDFFPEYMVPGLDPRKSQITLKNLITFRAGFDNSIEDYDINWNRWVSSSDWIEYTIQLPLLHNPGTHFAYITAETHLLSAIITKATGMSTMAFAQKFLFTPLKISIREWERDPGGYYIGGMSMHFRPRDMARFGLLYLEEGYLEGVQIVPADWIKESLDYHTSNKGEWGALQNIGYGYQWWLGEIRDQECFMALGYGGQFIMVFPQIELIVVSTSDWHYYKDVADQHERAILAICSNNILTAIGN
jgi:CubicO group peptidase (beta-lactamase class C family)